MNLWFRLAWLLLTFRLHPRLQAPLGVSRLRARVWPTDLDLNGHLNNGRALTLMDVGRIDLTARSGLLKVMLRKRWMPIISCSATRYSREMACFAPFVIQSRVLCWEGTTVVMEHKADAPWRAISASASAFARALTLALRVNGQNIRVNSPVG